MAPWPLTLSHQLTSPEAPEHAIAGLLLQCHNVIMSLKINVHKRVLLRMTERHWCDVLPLPDKEFLYFCQEFRSARLSVTWLNLPALRKSQTFFMSCGNLWKSPVTVSDSPMNNWARLSVPPHLGTLQEGNKCEGQSASIKAKNWKTSKRSRRWNYFGLLTTEAGPVGDNESPRKHDKWCCMLWHEKLYQKSLFPLY